MLTELKSKPSVIELNHKRLVFIVRGSILNSETVLPRTERFPSYRGGLLQIDMTGKQMWCIRVDPLPDKIDCTLLNSQLKDNDEVYCIVGATNGNLLGVVSSHVNKGDLRQVFFILKCLVIFAFNNLGILLDELIIG